MIYILFDLEATCCEDKHTPESEMFPDEEMETIQIGATILGTDNHFDKLCRPIKHPKLTEYCTNLTGITQDQVDQACTFKYVYQEFKRWIEFNTNNSNFKLISWGDWDKWQLHKDAKEHGEEFDYFAQHTNLKAEFSTFAHQAGLTKREYRFGLKRALKLIDEQLVHPHHNALSDAKSNALVLQYMLNHNWYNKHIY